MRPGTWMTSYSEELWIWEFEKKKTVSWDLNSERKSRFSVLAETRPVVCGGGAARGGVQMEKSA